MPDGRDPFETIESWLRRHPSVFAHHSDGDRLEIMEIGTGKVRSLSRGDVQAAEVRSNRVEPEQTYAVALLSSGAQLVCAPQSFAFAPDTRNCGPVELPSPVFCMTDFHTLFAHLQHIEADADDPRQALDLIMVLIAILDGARAVGLDVDAEARRVDAVLSRLEGNGER